MPAVGMRRTRRVFGVVKGSTANRERVLRSGRRLWLEDESPSAKKTNTTAGGDEWIRRILDHKSSTVGWHNSSDSHKSSGKIRPREVPFVSEEKNEGEMDKMFGIKYYRKRKKNVLDYKIREDKKYGIKFARKRRKIISSDVPRRDTISVVVEYFSSSGGTSRFSTLATLLTSILGYMSRNVLRMRSLSAFLLSDPIASVFSSHGIQFLQHLPTSNIGACIIFGAKQLVPLFSVNYSALPLCFMHIQISILLRCERLFFDLVVSRENDNSDTELDGDFEESSFMISSGDHPSISLGGKHWKRRGVQKVASSSPGPARVTRRSAQSRNGFNSHSTQGKRSSLRSKRARNPAFLLALPNTTRRTRSGSYSTKRGSVSASAAVSNQFRRSARNRSAVNLKESKADMVGQKEASSSASCFTNILVMEPDRCYREEGATITLDHSSSNSMEGFLVVKKDGQTRCSFKAEDIMRPCASNRVTHAIIWTVDDYLKLEFPNRADWSLFKDLYKKCSQLNVVGSTAKMIPIPGVSVVSSYEDDNGAIFSRPASYIKVDGDEISRALARKGPYYDMDSEDEEWLERFNLDGLTMSGPDELVSQETFEFMVYELEKAFYQHAGEFSDEKAAALFGSKLAKKEVIEVVYNYWVNKRNQKPYKQKQKQPSLVRVFQNYQPSKSPLLPDAVSRRKRSSKRRPNLAGRGKQRYFLPAAIVVERDDFDEERARRKVAEAEASANRYIETAIAKRRRAQDLMESASIIAHKALKALRIAEAVQVAGSLDTSAASNFIEQFMDTDISKAN